MSLISLIWLAIAEAALVAFTLWGLYYTFTAPVNDPRLIVALAISGSCFGAMALPIGAMAWIILGRVQKKQPEWKIVAVVAVVLAALGCLFFLLVSVPFSPNT